MRRKLIAQGLGGITLTLPKSWIGQRNLRPGIEVEITETDEGLLINADNYKIDKKLELDLTEYDNKMVLNLIYQSYRLGYDIISIKLKDKEQNHLVQELVQNNLLGFEVVESKNNYCIIQNIAEPEKEKFEVLLRRLFFQIQELQQQGKESNEELRRIKIQIDKMTNYLRRTLVKNKIGGSRAMLLHSIIALLSLIAHDYIYLFEQINKNKKKIDSEVLELLEQTNNMFKEFHISFYDKDKVKINNIGKNKEQLFQQADAWLEKSKGLNSVCISNLKEIIRLIQACATYSLGYNL